MTYVVCKENIVLVNNIKNLITLKVFANLGLTYVIHKIDIRTISKLIVIGVIVDLILEIIEIFI